MEALQWIPSMMGADARALAPDLLALVSSSDLFESADAAHALVRVRPAAAEVVPPLLALVQHPVPHVRRSAIRALHGIVPSDPVLLQTVVTELRRQGASIRLDAALYWTAGRHEPSLSATTLADLLGSDVHEELRATAAHALGTMETLTPAAVAALQMAANDASEAVRNAARSALEGNKKASDPLFPVAPANPDSKQPSAAGRGP
jgi:HEAT repeat protein